MTKRLDLGGVIAGVSALVAIGAVIAGFIAVGGPGDARAVRLDALQLRDMQVIANVAQCAYAATNRVPASLDEIHSANVDQRQATTDVNCNQALTLPQNSAVTYAAEGTDRIRLCATFRRPTPPAPANAVAYPPVSDFPELNEPRAAAGAHCYVVRLVKAQATPSGAAAEVH